MTDHSAAPPIGRRPVPRVNEDLQAERPAPPPTMPATSPEPNAAATRLLIGSHLLLLIQSLLILGSGIELGIMRVGIAAVSGISLAALVWAGVGRFTGRRRYSGRRRDAA